MRAYSFYFCFREKASVDGRGRVNAPATEWEAYHTTIDTYNVLRISGDNARAHKTYNKNNNNNSNEDNNIIYLAGQVQPVTAAGGVSVAAAVPDLPYAAAAEKPRYESGSDRITVIMLAAAASVGGGWRAATITTTAATVPVRF